MNKRKGFLLITQILIIIVLIIIAGIIILNILSNESVIQLTEEAVALSNFVTIKSEVDLLYNSNAVKKLNYDNILELLPIERDEEGNLVRLNATNDVLLYSEIKILQGLENDPDLTKVYKLNITTSDNAYAIVDEKNKKYEIILATGVRIKNYVFYSSKILECIIKINHDKSLAQYKEIINKVFKSTKLTNKSENGSFENGVNTWNFYNNTQNYSQISLNESISGESSLNIDCSNPQDKEYSIYKDLTDASNGDLLYMAASIYIPSPTPNIYTLRKANYASWNAQNNVRYDNKIVGEWQRRSMIRPISSGETGARLYIGIVENKEIKAPINIYIDDVVVVNLTRIFGNNMPTQEQCDILFSKYYNGDIYKQYLYYTVATHQSE
ncbi:MAG: hypothetical protein N2749_03575 [Clostridia bacterium]|nr:hypothetical protein [Clostridia bacterium]